MGLPVYYVVFGREPGEPDRYPPAPQREFARNRWVRALKFAFRLRRKGYTSVHVLELTVSHSTCLGDLED